MAVILSESFEADPGYDATWGENVGTGCSLNEDSTAVARPTGGGNQILAAIYADTGNKAAATNNLGATGYAVVYGRLYTHIASTGLSLVSSARLFVLGDTSNNGYVAVYYNATTSDWQVDYYTGGSFSHVHVSLNTDQWYLWEWYYNVTSDILQIKLDGTLIVDVTLTDTHRGNHRYTQLGDGSDRGFIGTLYYDLVKMNDGDGWIGAEAGAATSILRQMMAHHGG